MILKILQNKTKNKNLKKSLDDKNFKIENFKSKNTILVHDEVEMIPNRIFFTKGVGKHKEQLQSFEMALRDAGIEKCNIVSVSSIFPPGCKIIPRAQGLQKLKAGEIVFCVMARMATNEPNRLLAASIGLAVPADQTQHGYLSEHHSFGETDDRAGDYAEDLAASMLASTLGVEFDPNSSYDDRKETWKISDKIVKTSNYTQSAIADKNGLWTTVLAAAVLLYEEENGNGHTHTHTTTPTPAQPAP